MKRILLLAISMVIFAKITAPLEATVNFNFEGEIALEHEPLFVEYKIERNQHQQVYDLLLLACAFF